MEHVIIGKIYKLINIENNTTYFGSTYTSINQRKYSHKYHYKTSKQCSSKIVFNNAVSKSDFKNIQIILLEQHLNISVRDLKLIENHYIITNICVNKNNAIKTRQSMYDTNRRYYEKNQKRLQELNLKAYYLKKAI
jgi:hypothetical protein